MYKLRLKLIIYNNMFNFSNFISSDKRIQCECKVTYIISHLLPNCPRAVDTSKCIYSVCSNQNLNVFDIHLIPININIIKDLGFKNLENSIENAILKSTTCRCNPKMSHDIQPNSHLFIECTDCGSRTLSDMPITIKYLEKSFVLRGVVNYVDSCDNYSLGHYNAYCRRLDSPWELFDDILKQANNFLTNRLFNLIY